MKFWIWFINGYDYRASDGDHIAGDDVLEWLQSSDHQQVLPGGFVLTTLNILLPLPLHLAAQTSAL